MTDLRPDHCVSNKDDIYLVTHVTSLAQIGIHRVIEKSQLMSIGNQSVLVFVKSDITNLKIYFSQVLVAERKDGQMLACRHYRNKLKVPTMWAWE